jgi:hypothetical protein
VCWLTTFNCWLTTFNIDDHWWIDCGAKKAGGSLGVEVWHFYHTCDAGILARSGAKSTERQFI